MSHRTMTMLVGLAALSLGMAQTGGAGLPNAGLPLGPVDLEETRTVTEVAPGVTRVQIIRGSTSEGDAYTVEVGFAVDEAEAQELTDQLREAGYEPRLDGAALEGPDGNELGTMVRTGMFTTQEEAEAVADELEAQDFSARVRHTAEDGGDTRGPWVIHVLEIDPAEFEGDLRAVLAKDAVLGRETVSSVAERTGALAAVNAGFFVWSDDLGTEGDPAGMSVIDGRLVSESINGRPIFMLQTRDTPSAEVRHGVTTEITVSAAGSVEQVEGVNREPGYTLNCGNPGDLPITAPAHDHLCRDASEIVLFTADYGPNAPEGEGVEVVLSEDEMVTSVSEMRGGEISENGSVLQGIGEGATWLRTHAEEGEVLHLEQTVRTQNGVLALEPGTYAVNGGPTLVRGGEVVQNYAQEGWSPQAIDSESRAAFYNAWVVRRNPRTAAGVTEDGTLLLMVADGRQPEYSVGLSVLETAEVMRHLGAQEVINLDGGGSSAMVVRGELVSQPSDSAGEREDADALVVLP